jgi:HEAT repeat protein
MFAPSPLPRNLEAAFRDLSSDRAAARASAVRDVVRHALRSDVTRARAIPQLETALREDPAPAVRAEAAIALADVRAQDALPTLLYAIEDEDSHVRQMALSALGEIGDARACGRIERALCDSRPEVRYQAVIAFARLARDDAGAVAAALTRALDDGDGAIRYIAMRVAEERLAEGDAIAAASSLEARAIALLDGADTALAVVAGLYLARLGRPPGHATILDVVAERRRTPELEDEQACVELAGELGLREAIGHLEHRAWSPRRLVRAFFSWGAGDGASCAWHARIALARMGHGRARAEILAELTAWRRETREAAVVAVGRARMHEARASLHGLRDSVDPALLREALARIENSMSRPDTAPPP